MEGSTMNTIMTIIAYIVVGGGVILIFLRFLRNRRK